MSASTKFGIVKEAAAGLCVPILAAVLSGCVHYQPQPVSPAESLAALEGRSLDDEGLRRFLVGDIAVDSSWPLRTWDSDHLLLAAYYFHPDLEVGRAAWSVAKAAERTAGERPNVILSLFPAFNATNDDPSPWDVTSALELSLETAGKRGARRALAEQRAAAQRLRVAETAWGVREAVQRALVAIRNAEEKASLLAGMSELEMERLHIREAQLGVGDIAHSDLTRARIAHRETELAASAARQAVSVGRVDLAAAVGVPAEAVHSVELSFDDLDADLGDEELAGARRQTLLNHPGVLAALADYAAAETALRLEIAKQYPDFRLGPGFEFDQGDNKWGVGMGLTLPLPSRNRGAIGEALARRVLAATTFEAVQARVLARIERATTRYRAAHELVTLSEGLRDGLEEQVAIAEAMLQAGEVSLVELLGRRMELQSAELARSETAALVRRERVDLEGALQSPAGLSEALWRVPLRFLGANAEEVGGSR